MVILLLSLAAHADTTNWSVVPLDAVVTDPDPDPEAPLIRAAVSRVTAEITPGAESRVTLTYAIQVFADGLSVASLGAGPLTVESARLDGRAIAVPPDTDGHRRLIVEMTRGSHTVVLTGVMTTPLSTLSMPMPDAPVEVVVSGEGLDVTIDRGAALSADRLIVPPGPSLSVAWKPEAPPAPRPDRLEAAAAVGLTLSTDGMEGAGVVTFDAVRGAVDRVRIAVPGADWAEASGGVVASSTLSGQWLEVELVAPQTGRFTVEVALRGPAGEALSSAPLLLPEADSREGWVSIYQGEEGYLARQSSGLSVIAPGEVPAWGQDLSSGQLLSSLHYTTGRPTLTWKQSEWESLQTPGTVIDSAHYEVAVVAHGRALTRARYQVRNDRGAWLWMDLPEGSSVLVVRVAGHIVEPVRSGARLGIPLEKSVETLTGLVSFPVEVATLAPAPVFSRRGKATLSVPAVSAPVTDATWTLYLPPGTTTRRTEGNVQVAVAGEPDQELLIGRGYRQAGPPMDTGPASMSSSSVFKAEKKAEEASQDYWNQAYDAYKDNRFDEAGELLEQSLIYNPDNSSASALQGNVMVLTGEASAEDGDGEQVERVKAMARAKSKGSSQRQSVLVEDAEEQLWAGNVDEAIELYESAIAVSDQLANLESDEAYVQKAVAEDLRGRLAEAEAVSSRNRRQEESERREVSLALIEDDVEDLKEQVFRSTATLGLLAEETTEEEWEEGELARISSNNIVIHQDDLDQLPLEQRQALNERLGEVSLERITIVGADGTSRDYGGAINQEPRIEYNQPTEIDFEGLEVTGALVQPQAAFQMGAPPPPPPPVAASPEPVEPGEVLTKDFLQRIPEGRSYQASVQMAAGVTGGTNPNVGGASSNDNTYMLDGANISEPVTGSFDFHAGDSLDSDEDSFDDDLRWSDRRSDRQDSGLKAAEDAPVQTISAFDVPTGVTASRWIVLVPDSGPMLEFSRQLVPAGEVLEVVVPYKIDSKGKQGG
ncbi:MAG: tetratricopeptide (TPR) repeat protein [Myxococcota bacterium]|jgi:tetratricopeptide (TPR) repeat protein